MLFQIYKKCPLCRTMALIISVMFFAACSRLIDTPYYLVDELPDAVVLDGKPIVALDERIGIYDIDMLGEYFLCTEKRTEFFYSIYDSEFRLLSRFGKKGKSDNEFIAPVYTGQYEDGSDILSFNVLDRAQFRYDTWSLNCNENKVQKTGMYRIPRHDVFEMRALYRAADSSYFGVSDFDECKFFTTGRDFSGRVLYENVLGFKNGNAHEVSQSSCSVRPDGSRIVIAYYNLPQLDIRESDGAIVRTVFIGHILMPEDANPSVEYFIKTDADQDYIYALYEDHDTDEDSDSILVFDWDGNLVARYKIRTAISFCADGANHRIISVNSDRRDNVCMLYDL